MLGHRYLDTTGHQSTVNAFVQKLEMHGVSPERMGPCPEVSRGSTGGRGPGRGMVSSPLASWLRHKNFHNSQVPESSGDVEPCSEPNWRDSAQGENPSAEARLTAATQDERTETEEGAGSVSTSSQHQDDTLSVITSSISDARGEASPQYGVPPSLPASGVQVSDASRRGLGTQPVNSGAHTQDMNPEESDTETQGASNNIPKIPTYPIGPASNRGWGIPKGLGLLGGSPAQDGGSGPGGWGGSGGGSTATANANNTPGQYRPPAGNPNQMQGQQNQTKGTGSGSWAAATAKGLPNLPPSNNSQPAEVSNQKQLEQLKSIRESILSQEGWGGHTVNQDTGWDLPASPPRSPKDESTHIWKAQVNNGTELWETNIRHGGAGRQEVIKPPVPPWGQHTPSNTFGGTWGEEDDSQDSANLWSGIQGPPGALAGPNNANTNNAYHPGAWGEAKKPENSWGNNNWDTPRPENGWKGQGVQDVKNVTNPPWGPPPPNDIRKTASGWEEPSPPTERRGHGYDDGTAIWGNPTQQPQQGISGKVSRWKEMPRVVPPGAPPRGGPPTQGSPQVMGKPDHSAAWGGRPPNRNVGTGNWGDLPPDPAGPVSGWGEEATPPRTPSWTTNPKTPTNPGWDNELMDPTANWGKMVGQNRQMLTKEQVWNSRNFRMMAEMGYKKEDIENALRNNNMNAEEALQEIQNKNEFDNWRRPNDEQIVAPIDAPPTLPLFQTLNPAQRFSSPQLPFNQGGNSGGGMGLERMVHQMPTSRMMQPQQQAPGPGAAAPVQQQPFQPPNNSISGSNASTLRFLVQQIHLAVQSGHLNPQILNQPLAPQTLLLLNQLLTQIRTLTHLQTLLNQARGSGNALQLSVKVTQTKQQIQNLQNQITAQQALYIQKSQNPTMGGGHSNQVMQPVASNPVVPPSDIIFKTPPGPGGMMGPIAGPNNDCITGLGTAFGDMTMTKDPQGSRLNTWKFPSPIDKDMENRGGVSVASTMDFRPPDFSRAPGPLSKSSSNLPPPLFDSPWTPSPNPAEGAWPDSTTQPQPPVTSGINNPASSTPSSKPATDWTPVSSSVAGSNSTYDLVPEFEPGKPWKGSQLKNIEDDPTITPGSVARSPLLPTTLKDPDLFGNSPGGSGSKAGSPATSDSGPIPPFSLGGHSLGSTWTPLLPTSMGTNKQQGWNEFPGGGDLWDSRSNGRGGNNANSAAAGGNPVVTSAAPPPGQWGGNVRLAWDRGASTWLVLRNLTPQIDGSTLKTLCAQHGPLQGFHLLLSHGLALVRYRTREEAAKAQHALNSCVLGNTTILVDFAGDSEVQSLLQSNSKPGGESWGNTSSSRLFPQSASLWGDGGEHSFLPGDLLGGENI